MTTAFFVLLLVGASARVGFELAQAHPNPWAVVCWGLIAGAASGALLEARR